MYEEINLENYDFLWRVNGQHYLSTSFWLHVEYLKRDFVCVIKNNCHFFYVAKRERTKLSKAGLALFSKTFNKYEKVVKQQLKISKKEFLKVMEKDLRQLSNKELAIDFEGAVKFWEKLWRQYFWAEYFLQDKVSDIIQTNDKKYNLMIIGRNVKKMARLKYQQREILNSLFYPGGVREKYQNEIAKRMELGKNIIYYHYKELIELLRGKKVKIPDRLIAIRGKFSRGKDILGKEAEKIMARLEKIDYKNRELKGMVANKGYYRGRVKNIEFGLETNYVKEINAMKKGDVLVSGSTGPELIFACKKAGAIITEEGGITSHAALISRELGIPCIINTKIATQVLKDGDLVEVDADRGVVRMLKKV